MSTSKTSSVLTAATVALLCLTSLEAAAHRPATRPVTAGEAARIRYQVQQHQHLQRRAHLDGVVTRHEQAHLNRDAAQIRHLIHTAKTN